ncbi:hypothetical protein [Lacticaseibacillus mingshuiensis]|uniref:hypothetical protein n=1 Tax=Lacticaseibacillus mingshuiensis TaxID=2799574 RepID=UPI0019502140
MSDETKWDVFEELQDAYDDAKSSNGNLHPTQELLDYDDRYASALPDDLPVIPEAVGDDITYAKANGMSIGDVLWRCGEGGMFDCDEVESWINDHSDTFATAWVLVVWRVEETDEIVKLGAEK